MPLGSEERVMELIMALVKAIKAHQMYGAQHPSFHGFFEPVVRKLSEYLDQIGLLEFQIEKFTILHDRRVVYEETEKDVSIAFRLFRDGIRDITFSEGLSAEELLQFITKISAAARDQDLALSLWESNFSHISFYVVEEEEETLTYAIPELPVYDINYGAHVRDILALERIDLVRPVDASLGGADLAALQSAVAAENNQDIASAIATLISCLRYQSSAEITGSLIELLEQCIDRRDFGNARRIVEALSACPDLKVIERFQSETVIIGFRDVPDQVDERGFNEFLGFIGLFSRITVPPLIIMSASVRNTERKQALRSRIAYLAQDDPELVHPFLLSPSIPELTNAIAILGLMHRSDVLERLRPLFVHPEPAVRSTVIEALFNLSEPASIMRFIDDLDPAVRIHALQALTASQYKRAFKPIQRRIQTKEFRLREIAEQREYITCLVGVGEPRKTIRFLEKVLFKWILFGAKRYRVMRKLAAYGLAQIGTDEALAILSIGRQKANRDIQQASLSALKGS